MTRLYNTKKKTRVWQQQQVHKHLPQFTIFSDTHLTPDACHIKDTQNARTSLRESVLIESQSTEKATNLEIEAAAGKSFLF